MIEPVAARGICVGVTSRFGDASWIEENTRHYLNILAELGADSLVLSPDTPVVTASGVEFTPDQEGRLGAAVLQQVDGLILAGGGDVDPVYFGAQLAGADAGAIDRRRDELELELARFALEIDLPIFGICRGCQVLNVAAGGGMVQHFQGHRSPQGATAYHDVSLVPGSRLHAVIGKSAITVNTFHHQGVDQDSLASSLRPAAFALPDTWLIEAVESASHSWAIGVQWHPERLFELDGDCRVLWGSFLKACRNHSHI